jgi:hypothetical protein
MPITSYSVYWHEVNPVNYDYTLLATIDAANPLTYSTNAVVSGKAYKFKVLATSMVGDSSLSAPITIIAGSVPDAPDKPVLNYQSSTSIIFDWIAPSDNFDPILDYKVYWDQGLGGSITLLSDSTSNLLTWT